MTLHHLRNAAQFLNNIVEFGRILQVESDVGTGFVAHFLRVDDKLRTLKDSQISEFLDSLMDCRSTDIARTCHLKEWDSGVFGNEFEYFLIEQI